MDTKHPGSDPQDGFRDRFRSERRLVGAGGYFQTARINVAFKSSRPGFKGFVHEHKTAENEHVNLTQPKKTPDREIILETLKK